MIKNALLYYLAKDRFRSINYSSQQFFFINCKSLFLINYLVNYSLIPGYIYLHIGTYKFKVYIQSIDLNAVIAVTAIRFSTICYKFIQIIVFRTKFYSRLYYNLLREPVHLPFIINIAFFAIKVYKI